MRLVGKVKKAKKEEEEPKPIPVAEQTEEKSGSHELPRVEDTFLLSISYATANGEVRTAPLLVTDSPLDKIEIALKSLDFGTEKDQVTDVNISIKVVNKEVD